MKYLTKEIFQEKKVSQRIPAYLVSLKPRKPLKPHATSLPNARQRENSKQRGKSALQRRRYQEHQPPLTARFRDFSAGGRKRSKPIGNLCSTVGQGRVGAREVNARVYHARGGGKGGKKQRQRATGHNRCSINSVVGGLLWEPATITDDAACEGRGVSHPRRGSRREGEATDEKSPTLRRRQSLTLGVDGGGVGGWEGGARNTDTTLHQFHRQPTHCHLYARYVYTLCDFFSLFSLCEHFSLSLSL